MSKIFIRKMSGRDIAEVSELAPLANPHAIKEEYKKRIIKVLEENPDLSWL
ncbi:hypothetical protein KEJ37_02155 [Candidatus Bathyarchaeota archaeon]|nr:hypothetical protein [Candidatus Bathyarchaeota archaeon]